MEGARGIMTEGYHKQTRKPRKRLGTTSWFAWLLPAECNQLQSGGPPIAINALKRRPQDFTVVFYGRTTVLVQHA